MKLVLEGGPAAQSSVDVLVVGVAAPRPPKVAKAAKATAKTKKAPPKESAPRAPWGNDPVLTALDAQLGGALAAQAAREEFTGKANSAVIVNTLGRGNARTVVLIGLGDARRTSAAALRSLAARASRIGNAERAKTIAIVAPDDDAETVRYLAEGACSAPTASPST